MKFKKAVKHESKLRLALMGTAGSGKTYTALQIAQGLGGRVAVLDTEHGSASKYADIFPFDTMSPDEFSVETYIEAINAASAAGYAVLIIDSLSHAWAGKGGLLEFVDTETAKSRSHNAFSAGWRKATPKHNLLIDTILGAKLHIIATMRTKTAYVVEKDDKGRSAPRKVGLQPVQRDGLEYEFDVVADLDIDNNLLVGKTRCPDLSGKVFNKAGDEIARILLDWLSGEAVPEPTSARSADPLDAARETTTKRGARYDSLSLDQLQYAIDHPGDYDEAAAMMVYDDIIVRAKVTKIPEGAAFKEIEGETLESLGVEVLDEIGQCTVEFDPALAQAALNLAWHMREQKESK